MSSGWESIVRFEAEDGQVYFAPLPLSDHVNLSSKLQAFKSIEDIENGVSGVETTVKRVS